MIVVQARRFRNAVKRLHSSQKTDVDTAVRAIIANPDIGERKKGDLAGISVFKFRMANQIALLAYAYATDTDTLNLIDVGSHENFYRDLKS